MPSDERDKTDRQLLRDILGKLFHEPFSELAGQSVRQLLQDIVQEEWERLTQRLCERHGRALPNEEDALGALDAIKHSITADAQQREIELPDPAKISQLTRSELNKYILSRMQVKHWMALALAVSAVFGAGAGFAEFVRRIAN